MRTEVKTNVLKKISVKQQINSLFSFAESSVSPIIDKLSNTYLDINSKITSEVHTILNIWNDTELKTLQDNSRYRLEFNSKKDILFRLIHPTARQLIVSKNIDDNEELLNEFKSNHFLKFIGLNFGRSPYYFNQLISKGLNFKKYMEFLDWMAESNNSYYSYYNFIFASRTIIKLTDLVVNYGIDPNFFISDAQKADINSIDYCKMHRYQESTEILLDNIESTKLLLNMGIKFEDIHQIISDLGCIEANYGYDHNVWKLPKAEIHKELITFDIASKFMNKEFLNLFIANDYNESNLVYELKYNYEDIKKFTAWFKSLNQLNNPREGVLYEAYLIVISDFIDNYTDFIYENSNATIDCVIKTLDMRTKQKEQELNNKIEKFKNKQKNELLSKELNNLEQYPSVSRDFRFKIFQDRIVSRLINQGTLHFMEKRAPDSIKEFTKIITLPKEIQEIIISNLSNKELLSLVVNFDKATIVPYNKC